MAQMELFAAFWIFSNYFYLSLPIVYSNFFIIILFTISNTGTPKCNARS